MSSFAAIPGHQLPTGLRTKHSRHSAFTSLSTRAELKAGISTGDNPTFERQWYEGCLSGISRVGSETRSVPHVGHRVTVGTARRWYGNNEVVMDWENGGSRSVPTQALLSAIRRMGRGGLTYSKIGGARFAVRTVLRQGFVFTTREG